MLRMKQLSSLQSVNNFVAERLLSNVFYITIVLWVLIPFPFHLKNIINVKPVLICRCGTILIWIRALHAKFEHVQNGLVSVTTSMQEMLMLQ